MSGAAWSANDCPEGALDSAAIRSSLLLSCVVLKAVLKQWRVPAFPKGGLADLPTLVGGSPLPSILHVSAPHEVSPWSKSLLQCVCSLHTTLAFAHVEQWVRPEGMGEKAPVCSHCLWPVLPFPPRGSRGEQMSP